MLYNNVVISVYSWIKKNFKVSHGVQLDEKLSKELVTEMLCGYEGYYLHGQSMCLPCQPGHHRPKERKFREYMMSG